VRRRVGTALAVRSPFRRLSDVRGCLGSPKCLGRASLELRATEVFFVAGSAVHWFTAGHRARLFPCGRSCPSSTTVPENLSAFSHPSIVTAPQSSFVHVTARALSSGAPPTRVSALSTTSRCSVHTHEAFQASLCSAPRCSQPPGGFLHFIARGLVSSHSRAQDPSRSRASLSAQAFGLIGRLVPPCRWLASSSLRLHGEARAHVPRLRGFAPREGAFSPVG